MGRWLTISGGKGGTGKTFCAINLAVGLKERGFRVLVFDADFNLSNTWYFVHSDRSDGFFRAIRDNPNLSSIKPFIQKGVGGIDLIYNGEQEIVVLKKQELVAIIRWLRALREEYDFVIVDTQAGLNKTIVSFMLHADAVLLIANPEGPSILDTAKMIRYAVQWKEMAFGIILNRAKDPVQAKKQFDRLRAETDNKKIDYLGFLPNEEELVPYSIEKRIPFLLLFEDHYLTACMNQIIDRFLKKNHRRFLFL